MCSKISSLISSGHIVFDESGLEVGEYFSNDEAVGYKHNGHDCSFIHFLKDEEFDNGAMDSIKDYDKKFSEWKFIHPDNIKRLVRRKC